MKSVSIIFGKSTKVIEYETTTKIRGKKYPTGLDQDYFVGKNYKMKYTGGSKARGTQTWRNIRWGFFRGRGTGRGSFNPHLPNNGKINILKIQKPVEKLRWHKYRPKIRFN